MKKGTEDTCDEETVSIWTQQREESLVGVRGVTGDALLQCMEREERLRSSDHSQTSSHAASTERFSLPGEVICHLCQSGSPLRERKWAQDAAVRGVWDHGGSSAEAHSSKSVMIQGLMVLNTGLKSRNSRCAPTFLQVSEAHERTHEPHESPQNLSGVVGSGVEDSQFSCHVLGAKLDWEHALLGCIRQLLLL